MFDRPCPRLFALPPGVDFPGQLVAGLQARLAGQPPERMAEVVVYLNTTRMRRAVTEAFLEAGPGFLPRLRLVTDLAADVPLLGLPPATSSLRRRLELAQLVARLLDRRPDLAPRAAIFDLADSLADLMDEMQGEGVPPEALARLDVAGHAAHWQRTQEFLAIVAPLFAAAGDPEARQRLAVAGLAARWQAGPPDHPVIVAGSTGSRGTTALLMQAVCRLPQGALVLPGFDTDLPAPVWAAMGDALTGEDHPQFRFRKLTDALGLTAADIRRWTDAVPARPAFNRLISLSLRPAPVTDHWLTEGKHLPDLPGATAHVTLVEAPDPRAEALAIALILRQAVEEGTEIALITPDRLLTRRVAAVLDRWRILADDSAGEMLSLTAPGRLLRHAADLPGQRLTAAALLTVLKHPLTASGAGRGDHLMLTRELELQLRRSGPVFPTPGDLRAFGAAQHQPGAVAWADWLARTLAGLDDPGAQPLTAHVARHRALAEALAAGPGGQTAGGLWSGPAGEEAWHLFADLEREAPHGGTLTPFDYRSLFGAVLARGEVREPVRGHPLIRFLGPREARECRAPRVVLGGLNDGIWPRLPDPDPWLNRAMRAEAGLLLPERQVGLSAHDYQQAVAACEVVLTRALRDGEAGTVPARWLNRLTNLMGGLPDRDGPKALEAMHRRGRDWLDLAQALDAPVGRVPPAPRPAPRPPVAARPRELPVTGIGRLIRDPYAIYARYVLRLYPLDPLHPEPDALARGSALHKVLDRFIAAGVADPPDLALARLLSLADTVLAEEVPWPSARILWRARMERIAPAFVAREAAEGGVPVLIEERGSVDLPGLPFRLTARPDRIDRLPDGTLHILDYKTGDVPSVREQEHFEKQLLLEAAMAERGAFRRVGPQTVSRISYIGLKADAKVLTTEITPEVTARAWEQLNRLIGLYACRAQGYAARRAPKRAEQDGDYDQLARFGEWAMTDRPVPEDVGPGDVG
jgi:ATP-dependent helicase/nuclease subunit B